MSKERNEMVPFIFTHPDNSNTVTVTAPKRIVLSIGQAIGTLRSGFQPMNVDPIDWMGFVRIFIPLLPLIVVATFFNDYVGLIVVVAVWALLDMGRTSRMYYRDIMRKYLSDGYTLSDSSLEESLKVSKTIPVPEKKIKNSNRNRIIAYIVGTILLLSVTSLLGGENTVDIVRNGYLNSTYYPQVSLGEAAEQNLMNPEWTSFTFDGVEYVNLTGYVEISEMEGGGQLSLAYQFVVDPETKQFALSAIEVNGLGASNEFWVDYIYGM